MTIAATAATTASLTAPGSWLWLARHEGRLAWRDLRYLMTGGGRWRGRNVIIVFILLALGLHLIAFGVVGRHAHMTLEVGTRGFTNITGSLLLIFFLLLSQALEQVTRLFYGRGDLDLFRSSPASLRRIFVIRVLAIAVSTTVMALVIAFPAINVLAHTRGKHAQLHLHHQQLSTKLLPTTITKTPKTNHIPLLITTTYLNLFHSSPNISYTTSS